jgi:uncharacterized repeat protein (TIGR02543 family)
MKENPEGGYMIKKMRKAVALFAVAALVFAGCQQPSSVATSAASISVTGVTVTPETTGVVIGKTVQLTAVVAPSDATNAAVSWSSSDTNIATVTEAGLVSGVAIGSATITATTSDGSFTDVCAVTVTADTVSVTGVVVSPKTVSLSAGGTSTLSASVAPSDATVSTVTWTTSNSNVASVSAAGVVTAVGAGSATITATTTDGNLTDTSVVSVADQTLFTATSETDTLSAQSSGGSTFYQAILSKLGSTNKTVAGDVYYVTLAGSSSVALDALTVQIVENGAKTGSGYGWVTLSAKTTLGTIIPAGKPFSYTVAIPATSSASIAGADYNKIVIETGSGTTAAPTLTLTNFTVVKKGGVAPVSSNKTVTFNLNYTDSINPASTVITGSTVSLVTPSYSGYSLDGWYEDAACTTAFSAATTITADKTLYAKWTAVPTYTVSFESNGGSAVTSQTISQGDVATAPSDPTYSGYGFKGWYSDSSLTTKYDFSTAVTANKTLYAKWLAKFVVDFESGTPTFTYFAAYGSTTVTSTVVTNPSPVSPDTSANVWSAWVNASYNTVPAIQITFPAGTTLASYSKVSVHLLIPASVTATFTSVNNTQKTWGVSAVATTATLTSTNGTTAFGSAGSVQVGAPTYINSASDTAWNTLTVTIDPTYAATLTGSTIYLGIGTNSKATGFYIDDITFE